MRSSDRAAERRAGRRRAREGGFTLLELMMALVMFSAVGLMATSFIINQTSATARTGEVASAQQGVRAALERIAADIRVVGQGLNFYDIQVPDMIVPNDGTSGVNTFTNNAISLLAIPDPGNPSNQLTLDPTVVGNGDVGDDEIVVTSSSNLTGLGAGERLILFNPNTGNSQVVALTGIAGLTLQFAGDALTYQFPAVGSTPAIAIKLNEVRYRARTVSGTPFLERKVNQGQWVRFIEGITGLTFTYFDDTGTAFNPTTQQDRRDIRRISIEVTGIQLRINTAGERRANVTLTTSAVPRNMLPAP